jgi:hypothetical protein
LRYEIDPYIPEEETESRDRKKILNSMAMDISRQIDQLVFVEDRDNIEPPSPGSSTDNSHPEEPFENTVAIEDEDIDNTRILMSPMMNLLKSIYQEVND